MFALIVDIHDRVVAEQTLKENEQSLGITLDALSEAVIATDKEGRVKRVNRLAMRFTGYPLHELLERPVSTVFPVLEAKSGRKIDDLLRYVIDREGVIAIRPELKIHSSAGEVRDVVLSGTQVVDADGQISGFVIVFRDVTEEAELRAILNRDENLRSLGQVAGGVAHNFNNLLAGISGSAELLKLKNEAGWAQGSDRLVESILKTCARAADLSQKLVAFSAQNKLRVEPVDLHALVEEAVFIFGQTADKKLTLSAALNAKRPFVLGSAAEIQSLIMNLFLNAAHAMDNTGCVNVTTTDRTLSRVDAANSGFSLDPGRYVQIQVSDTGGGIPDALKDEVFRPFFSTKDGAGSVGLGLSTTYAAVVDMGGAIRFTSVADVGTTFTILLPTVAGPESTVEDADTASAPSRPLRLLLVDDEEMILHSTKLLLESYGHQVTTAMDGLEAVEKVRADPDRFDLLITDLSMPRMNGIAAAQQILAIRDDLGVIIISGHSAGVDVEISNQYKNLVVLRKPFQFKELGRTIDTLSER